MQPLFLLSLLDAVDPASVTGVAQVVFPHQANGSIIVQNGTIIGSELIGQNFAQDKYFHSCPSAAGAGYDAMLSGGSNLGPSNPLLRQRINTDINASRLVGETNKNGTVPIDAVTASGSGLDPHITLANALGPSYEESRKLGMYLRTFFEI